MAEQIVIAGLGSFGRTVAEGLVKAGYDVLAVDRRSEAVRELADTVGKTVQGDATRLSIWEDLPVKGAAIGIVAFSSSLEQNLLTALLFLKLGIKKVIAKSDSELHTELLQTIGVHAVVEPTKESARRLVHSLGANIIDYIELGQNFGVIKLVVRGALHGLPVQKLFDDKKVTALALQRGDRVTLYPREQEKMREGDTLLAAGKDEDLRRLAEAKD